MKKNFYNFFLDDKLIEVEEKNEEIAEQRAQEILKELKESNK